MSEGWSEYERMRPLAFTLILLLTNVVCIAPVMAQVAVLAPPWAYQIVVGMRLPELRTVSGKHYTRVRVEALDTQRIQFTHSQGRAIEWLVSIIDPNTYGNPAAGQSGDGGRRPVAVVMPGCLAAMMTDQQRTESGVDKLVESEQLTLKNWLSQGTASFPTANSGTHKLDRNEKAALMRWLNQKRVETNPGLSPPVPIRLPVNSSIPGQEFTGFEQGRVFKLNNGQLWQQTETTTRQYSRQFGGAPIRVHIRAAGLHYLMSIEGAGEIMVKPYR